MDRVIPPDDTLYDNAACGLLLTDTDGTIRRANATACGWLGYQAAELEGRMRAQDLLSVGARVFHQTHCVPILQLQGSVAEVQVEMRHREMSRIPMLINIIRHRHGDIEMDEWALFVANDRRSYERELLAARNAAEASLAARLGAEAQLHALNEQLSLADRRKDEFLATLSHELRNPLAPMRSALEVLKMKLPTDEGSLKLLAVFDRQMHHLTHLVDDLMEVSRITQGRMELRRSPIDLGPLLRLAADDVRDMIAAASQTLSVELPAAGAMVNADATRLTQVIVNLLTNATKYTPEGGQIALKAYCRDGEAVISVRDTGIGIPPESLTSVFDMFSQLEPALGRSKGGLGIGLALVKGIVALHGGTISAASEGVGKGTEFTVRLPLDPSATCGQSDAAPAPAVAPLRILVVDDKVDAADTLVMALGLFGCDARAAYNGTDGLNAAAGFAPQAALLDIGLPDMTGYELARRMRLAPDGAAMTLIAATGWGQESDKQLAYDAGFDHHLTKPIDFDKLREILAVQPP